MPLNIALALTIGFILYNSNKEYTLYNLLYNSALHYTLLGAIVYFLITRISSIRTCHYVIYVFGHEAAHAIATWMCLARVHEFRVSRTGGHVLSSKNNSFITLAPYFIPLYMILWIIFMGIVELLFSNVTSFFLFGGIGFWAAFHVYWLFECHPFQQPDLSRRGIYFSAMLILLINLLLLSSAMIYFSIVEIQIYLSIFWVFISAIYTLPVNYIFSLIG